MILRTVIKRIILGAAVLLLSAAVTTRSNGQEDRAGRVIFHPTDDSTIHCYQPDTVHGLSGILKVNNNYGAGGSPGWELDTLIKFDVSSLAAGTPVKSARLKLYYYNWWDNDPAGRLLTFYKITEDWDEATVTWNNQPSHHATSSASAIVPATINQWMVSDVTEDVRKFIDGQVDNQGWIIKDEVYWGYFNIPVIYFRSKNYGSFMPMLEVTLQPSLDVDKRTISARNGGIVNFKLAAGMDHAGRDYILLASMSGTTPGTMLPGGLVTMPLNWDLLTYAMVEHLNSPSCWNFMNILDGYGCSVAQLNVAGPLPADLVGEVMSFAYALYIPWDFASVPVEIVFVE
jgi:hypothetical protein